MRKAGRRISEGQERLEWEERSISFFGRPVQDEDGVCSELQERKESLLLLPGQNWSRFASMSYIEIRDVSKMDYIFRLRKNHSNPEETFKLQKGIRVSTDNTQQQTLHKRVSIDQLEEVRFECVVYDNAHDCLLDQEQAAAQQHS
jgi:hypothetical protein